LSRNIAKSKIPHKGKNTDCSSDELFRRKSSDTSEAKSYSETINKYNIKCDSRGKYRSRSDIATKSVCDGNQDIILAPNDIFNNWSANVSLDLTLKNALENAFDEPLKNTFNETMENTFNETMENAFNETMENAFDEPLKNTFNETMENAFDEPLKNTFNETMENAFDEPLDNALSETLNQILRKNQGSTSDIVSVNSSNEMDLLERKDSLHSDSSSSADSDDSDDSSDSVFKKRLDSIFCIEHQNNYSDDLNGNEYFDFDKYLRNKYPTIEKTNDMSNYPIPENSYVNYMLDNQQYVNKFIHQLVNLIITEQKKLGSLDLSGSQSAQNVFGEIIGLGSYAVVYKLQINHAQFVLKLIHKFKNEDLMINTEIIASETLVTKQLKKYDNDALIKSYGYFPINNLGYYKYVKIHDYKELSILSEYIRNDLSKTTLITVLESGTSDLYDLLEGGARIELFDPLYEMFRNYAKRFYRVKKNLTTKESSYIFLFHRDIKLENIVQVIDSDGRIKFKICDFGFICESEDIVLANYKGTMNYLQTLYPHNSIDNIRNTRTKYLTPLYDLGCIALCILISCVSTSTKHNPILKQRESIIINYHMFHPSRIDFDIFTKLTTVDERTLDILKRLHIFVYFLHDFNKQLIMNSLSLHKKNKFNFRWLDITSGAHQQMQFTNTPEGLIQFVGKLIKLIDGASFLAVMNS
jgi:hypothetical protein